MNTDRDPRTGQAPLPGFAESAPAEGRVPLPGFSEAVPADRTAQTRAEGIRRVRRMSNWTAAALIVGTGATTLALAHNAVPASAPTASSASTPPVSAPRRERSTGRADRRWLTPSRRPARPA